MDVLFVGLSPELISPQAFPSHLATVRPGGNIPGESWDAAFLRFVDQKSELMRGIQIAASTLRHGGQLALVALPPAPDHWDPLREALEEFGSDREEFVVQDGTRVVIVRPLSTGRQDLVGLRRSMNALATSVDLVENLCANVHERMSALRPDHETLSVREMVGALGDLDHFVYIPAIRSSLQGAEAPQSASEAPDAWERADHNIRTLAELTTRYRHFRDQSLHQLRQLEESDWLRPGPGPDGRTATVADLIRAWVREEARQVEELTTRVL